MKTHLLNYLLEASVCLAVFYAFYYLVLRKERFFAYNRIFILLALLLSLLIPVMEIPLSQQAIYISPQPVIDRYVAYIPLEAAEKAADPIVASRGSEVSSAGHWELVLYGYGVVAFLFLIRLLFQVKHLYSLAKGGIKEEQYTLIPTAGKLSTFSFFHWLFWDDTQALLAEEKNLILAHELVHIRQKHSWDTILLELVKIIFWFHPAIYLLKKVLQEVHEYLADQAVLYQHDSNLYTNLLARQHLRQLSVSFTHSFNQSQILKRIAMIQSARKSAKPAVWKMAFALPILATLLFTCSCQMKEAEAPVVTRRIDLENTYELPGMGLVSGSTLFNEENYRYGQYPKQDLDQGAYPVDGLPAYVNYMQNILKEPVGAPPLKTRRKVYVTYIVDADGEVRNPAILNGMGGLYDKAALDIFKHSPKWTPATKNGVPVSSTIVWAVTFGRKDLFGPFHPGVKELAATSVEGDPVPGAGGGLQAYSDKLTGLQYPLDARTNLVEGNVVIGFIVGADGKPENYKVIKKLYPSLDQ